MSLTKTPHQKGHGRGRPLGSTNKARFATSKLEALKLTPLVEILKLLNENDVRIADGDREDSSVGHQAELLKHRGAILRSLIPYQYSQMAEEQVVRTTQRKPVSIRLFSKSSEEDRSEKGTSNDK